MRFAFFLVSMFRTLPPTAAPVPFRDLLLGTLSLLQGAENRAKFEDQISQYFSIKHVLLVSSGKAAIYLTLKALEQMCGRREVVIPAYSSFCLASAVARSVMPTGVAA